MGPFLLRHGDIVVSRHKTLAVAGHAWKEYMRGTGYSVQASTVWVEDHGDEDHGDESARDVTNEAIDASEPAVIHMLGGCGAKETPVGHAGHAHHVTTKPESVTCPDCKKGMQW